MTSIVGSVTLPRRYHVPIGAIVFATVPVVMVVGLSIRYEAPAWVPVVMICIGVAGVAFRWRQGLALDEDGARITVYRTHRVSWADIIRFEPAGRGGVVVVTDAATYRSPAPCGGWGSAGTPAQLAELESVRQAARG